MLRLRNLNPPLLHYLLLLSPSKTLNPNPLFFPSLRTLCSSSPSSSSSSANPSPNPNESSEWTDDILYLDESDNLISSARAARPTFPGLDSHTLVGHRPTPIPPSSAASKLTEIALRWRWGPDLDSHLDRLHFVPDPTILSLALSNLSSSPDTALALFRWARRQPWFSSADQALTLVLNLLSSSASDFDSIQSIFDSDVLKDPGAFPFAANLAIQLLSQASSKSPSAASRSSKMPTLIN